MSELTEAAAAVFAAPVKARKKRYCFRDGDDVLLLKTVLADQDVFAATTGRKMAAWRRITEELNDHGVMASTHSLRCRLRRHVDTFRADKARGKQATDYSEAEQLLAEYVELLGANVGEDDSGAQKTAPGLSGESLAAQESADASEVSSLSGKARKKRFSFQDSHDVLLLKAMLADEGVVTASGRKKPAWKDITIALNRQGVEADTHSLRSHLRLLVDMHRKAPANPLQTATARPTEKMLLLQAFCNKLAAEEANSFGQVLGTTTRTQPPSSMAVTSTMMAPVAMTMPRSLPLPIAPAVEPTPEVRTPIARAMPAVPPVSHAAALAMTEESVEPSEPPTKKQRASLEVLLERFAADQNELRKEELEHKRAKFRAQQEMQRHTLALQERALEVQNKALEMQEKLMNFMDKVVDKLK